MLYDFQHILSRRLLVWSFFSLTCGALLFWQGQPFWRGFGLQALLWGAIDAIIAWFGLRGASSKWRLPVDADAQERDARRLRRILWVNTGLDVLYVAGGIALAFTLGANDPFWRGGGFGVIAQGGFLLLFDTLHALNVPREVSLPELGLFDDPKHAPFELPGQRGTVVLVHGFPGTPNEMRPLAEALQAAGWRTRCLLLPGFGKQITGLFQQRTAVWIDAIAHAVESARASGKPVVLCGFSMGGGLSVSAAARSRPDGLVLIAPFWFDEPPALRALVWLARVFLPVAPRPYRFARFPDPHLQAAATQVAPDIDLNEPRLQRLARDQAVPLLLLEQLRQIGFHLKRSAAQVTAPTLVVQGEHDPIVRPALSRKVAQRIGQACYVELPGEHHIILPDSPGFEGVVGALLDFVERVCIQRDGKSTRDE